MARCPGCALPSPAGLHCGACLRQPPRWQRAVAVADYGFPWDQLIAALKYDDQPELARPLAAELVAAVQDQGGPGAVDWVLPVPLAPSRLAQRGYNQAWELARRVAGQLSLRAHADGLQRLDGEQHQVGASRGQRLQQLREAFWVQPGQGPALAGARVALVDDVVTTGATAEAATLALQRAGVASVQLWMLARTPPPD
ncbi:MAG: ComF family protein [Burkholderiaceae bacterium]|nr:ComF family protein [Burkholderiaceae bacterium]